MPSSAPRRRCARRVKWHEFTSLKSNVSVRVRLQKSRLYPSMTDSPWTTTMEENGVLAAAAELGVIVLAYSPLGRGKQFN